MQLNLVLGKPIFSNEAADEPVSLSEAKAYLVISSGETAFDAQVTGLIKTARIQLEDYLNISLINRRITARLQNDDGYMRLPYAADSVTIVSVADDNSNEIDTISYSLKGNFFSANTGVNYDHYYQRNQDMLQPCVDNIVTVVYDVSGTIGEQFKTAIMQQVAWLYQNKGDVITQNLSPVAKLTVRPYRMVN
jgi:hypothetical protein